MMYYVYKNPQTTGSEGFSAADNRAINSIGTGNLQIFTLYGGLFSFARHSGYIVKPGTYSANFNVMITF